MNHTINIADTVKQFYSYLKGYIIKKTGDPVLAEDLTQEVMYRLIKADGENQKIHNVKAWLFQTTRHVIADYYRDQAKNPVTDVQEDLSGKPSKIDDSQTTDGYTGIPAADFILPIIKLLPKKYGQPLIMSDFENIPQKEIANTLNLGLSATKMRIKRARQKLHNLFVECCQIELDSRGEFAGCTIKDHCTPLWKIRNELAEKADF